MGIQQILFLVLLIAVGYLAFKLYGRLIRNIRLGKTWPEDGSHAGNLRTMLLVAFGQKKMFKRLIPAVLHLFIYVAFLFTQIELVEIIIDGLTGKHRSFASSLGSVYTLIINSIEFLSVLALVATLIFLWRRNVIRLGRFEKSEMSGWPKKDANLILIGEILLIIGIFSMNGADILLQRIDPLHYPDTGVLALSQSLGPLLFGGLGEHTLMLIERCGWWLHILVVFGFFLYLPISKHLHILFAFPNTYFSRNSARGKISNMPAIMNEVKSMMGLADANSSTEEIPEFGAKDVFDLTWKNLLEAYTCTECGRCTDECPANQTGKKLSPRKIMMDVRDRMEDIGRKIDSGDSAYMKETTDTAVKLSTGNFDDGDSLFTRISDEELFACTSCNACVEACPVLINPLEIILEMRRYKILTEGQGPADWVPMFTSLENSGSVWQVSTERDAWLGE